jgi:hypothetical protein
LEQVLSQYVHSLFTPADYDKNIQEIVLCIFWVINYYLSCKSPCQMVNFCLFLLFLVNYNAAIGKAALSDSIFVFKELHHTAYMSGV